jgi:DNA (cytosine-5)-methyltransferase 1
LALLIERRSTRIGGAKLPFWKAISLFSNCGAGDVGFRDAGFTFVVMAELDPRRLEVSIQNHPIANPVPGDLRDTWSEVVKAYREMYGERRPTLISACPPCQGLSSANCERGLEDDADAGSRDERNLLVVVVDLVTEALQSKFVVVENVPAFLTRKVRHPETGEPISAANLLISLLAPNYVVFPILVDLADYGVPQSRKRAFLTFVRRDVKGLKQLLLENRAPFPRPTHALDHGGEGQIELTRALREFRLPSLDARSQETAQSPDLPLHAVPVWKDRRYDMVAAIPPNSGATAWENDDCPNCGKVDVSEDDVICPRCKEPLLRPVIQDEDGTYRLITGFRTSSYKRMAPDRPAPTVTTASGHVGSNVTIHPFENRLMSTLEVALLQTIPRDFNWGDALENWGHTNVRAMIGEAVPPHFTRMHGEVLMGIATGEWTAAPISLSDPRCVIAREKLELAEHSVTTKDDDEIGPTTLRVRSRQL